jgi:hypothetical protein
MSIILFLLKAMGYGVGLSGGFWMCGMVTKYFEYYAIPLIDGRWNQIAGPKTSDDGLSYSAQFKDEWFLKPFKQQIELFARIKNALIAFNNA